MSLKRFNLDGAQEEAVRHTSTPLILYAGPGAGKTRTLIARAAYLIEDMGMSPNGVYLTTFTRRARAEMQERLADAITPGIAEHVNVMTLDATAFKILKALERIRETEISQEFRVADDEELFRHFKVALDLTRYNTDIMAPKDVWKTIKDWQARGRKDEGLPAELKRLIEKYEEQLRQSRLWDVSDLIPLSINALEEHPELAAAFHVKAFLLDEFQDTTLMQFELIKMLIGYCRNFFAVGAPSQSIYSFRFANPTHLELSIRKHFGEVSTKSLRVNYRSGEDIFKAACSFVPGAGDISGMRPDKEAGDVYLQELDNEVAEANFVAQAIKTVLASNSELKKTDIAVLARQWSVLSAVESALGREGINFQIAKENRRPYWETPEVAAMVGYLRAIQSIRDAQDTDPDLDGALDMILNHPARGIGPASHSIILDGMPALDWEGLILAMNSANLRSQVRQALKNLFEVLVDLANSGIDTPKELADAILEKTKWLEAVSDELDFFKIKRLLQENFSSEVAVFDTVPGFLESAYKQMHANWNMAGVNLSSVHAAKGLEWKVVFLIGMNEGIFPSAQASSSFELDEEARIAHVAASRAMDLLFCTWTRTRKKNNNRRMNVKPSRFLAGIKDLGKEYDEHFTYPGLETGRQRHVGRNPFRLNDEHGDRSFFGG